MIQLAKKLLVESDTTSAESKAVTLAALTEAKAALARQRVRSLATVGILHRSSDQRLVSFTSGGLTSVTFLGLALAPALILLWVVLGAIGCGSLIVIALSLFSLRTVNYPQAASLSGMAQSVG